MYSKRLKLLGDNAAREPFSMGTRHYYIDAT
jgi:hypothetical protein